MTCCPPSVVTTVAEGSAGRSAAEKLEEQKFRRAAKPLEEGLLQSDFYVPEMHCGACIHKIETGLRALAFVVRARVNLSTRRVSVVWREAEGSGRAIARSISDMGYSADVYDLGNVSDHNDKTGRRLLSALGVAGFAAANIMLLSVSVWSGAEDATRQLFHLISGVIATPAIAYAGQPFFRSAFQALKAGQLNMDVPISLAVLLAWSMSLYESLTGGAEAYFDASVTLLFFLLIGRYFDHRMREKARGAVTRLSELSAKGATIVQPNGDMEYVALADVMPGMKISVAAGERVPVDGRVVSGTGELDRSLVTGESAPVKMTEGSVVEAGTLNLTGHLVLEATRTAERSFLSEVIQMMEAAESGKARFMRIADRAASIYAPTVHLLAFLTFIGWTLWTGGDWQYSLYIAISVLIITCPCALALAVPIVHVVGASRLFEAGIMIKDGAAFEKLCDVDTVVFDKTGTLTTGTPQIVGGLNISDEALAQAAALAVVSIHPYSRAIAAYARGRGLLSSAAEGAVEWPGCGVEARVNGHLARLGRREWVQEIIPDSEVAKTSDSEVVFAVQGGQACVFGLADELRPDAVATLALLRAAGLELEILSGDRPQPVEDIASVLGVATYAWGQMPAEKALHIQALQSAGSKVLVVGDGLNDAPALAAGFVSMAPSSGSDVGRMAADLVFTGASLDAVTTARNIALRTGQLVTQNFAIAICYNCIAVPLAVAGHVTPLIAAIAMSASSVLVVANALRLNLGRGGAHKAAGDKRFKATSMLAGKGA